jgi:putative transposase
MKILKGRSAREVNKVLSRSGPFWHHESYDHVVRNEKELGNIINYILMNPVKAGFVHNWNEWKFSYCRHLEN